MMEIIAEILMEKSPSGVIQQILRSGMKSVIQSKMLKSVAVISVMDIEETKIIPNLV